MENLPNDISIIHSKILPEKKLLKVKGACGKSLHTFASHTPLIIKVDLNYDIGLVDLNYNIDLVDLN